MSSPFTGKKIIEAFFTNEAHDTIEVVYNDAPDDAEPYYVRVYLPGTDPDNYDVKNLFAEGYSYERVQEETIIRKQAEANNFRNIYKAYAAAEVERIKDEYQKKYENMISTGPAITSNIFQYIMDNNTDEEILFRTKLAVFEIPEIKKISDRSVKQKIRTAKSLLQLLGVVSELLK